MGTTDRPGSRTMALLWSPGTSPETAHDAARPALSLDAIVDAATALADESGTAAVPLRAVGRRLGCTAMALYTYVGGKDELLDVMYDRAHAELCAGPPPVSVTGWTDRLLELYVAHPWMLELVHARPVLGPHQQRVFESLLTVLAPSTTHRDDVAAIASSAFTLTAAAARTIVDARRARHIGGDEEPGPDRMAELATAAPDFADRFPLSSALMGAGIKGTEGAPEPAPDADCPEAPAGVGGTPPIERAARDNLRRSVELLLAGARR